MKQRHLIIHRKSLWVFTIYFHYNMGLDYHSDRVAIFSLDSSIINFALFWFMLLINSNTWEATNYVSSGSIGLTFVDRTFPLRIGLNWIKVFGLKTLTKIWICKYCKSQFFCVVILYLNFWLFLLWSLIFKFFQLPLCVPSWREW